MDLFELVAERREESWFHSPHGEHDDPEFTRWLSRDFGKKFGGVVTPQTSVRTFDRMIKVYTAIHVKFVTLCV